jgi:hypothetical protein
MKKNTLFLLLAVLTVAGCHPGYRYNDGIEYVSDDVVGAECPEYVVVNGVATCAADTQVVEYSTPKRNDLKLETAHHVIQMDGLPDKSYDYYIWAGDKTYADKPDIVVQDGEVSVVVKQ